MSVEKTTDKDQAEMIRILKKQLNLQRFLTLILGVMCIIMAVLAVILVPRVTSLLDQASLAVADIQTISGQVIDADIPGIVEDVNTLIDTAQTTMTDAQTAITDAQTVITDVSTKVTSFDIETLNASIQSLNDVVTPLGNLFGGSTSK